MKHHDYDVIVVGGGHAGTEAALAAHRMGARTALVTHRFDRLGEMSCNPAIGGLGKGHIVREIDALDGLMGVAADAAGIQFRLLNRSKGPAAQGPRTQTDRALYRRAVQEAFHARPTLSVIEDEVVDLLVAADIARGVALRAGGDLTAAAVILTTGTFLNGRIHIGHETRPAGRADDPAAERLATRMAALGLPLGRLKTGTPARLDGRTIDWTVVACQPGDDDPTFLSFLTRTASAAQICCGLTETNARTHDIIRDNLARSALYGGAISGAGPRYCPSIEDKVVRFADKPAHQVFLEPEGLDDPTVYPNGLSTSLPAAVQELALRSIRGLEEVQILRPGYAIEYDCVDPRALSRQLECRALPGLFLAGQINGTTGYEEAAGQGLLAGLNAAALALRQPPITLGRDESYIGVMIDDLVTRGVTEPYRMFTSRAEYRLHLRADNADQRLTPLGLERGCIGPERGAIFDAAQAALQKAKAVTQYLVVTPQAAAARGVSVNADGQRRSVYDLLAHPDLDMTTLLQAFPELADLDSDALAQIACEARYAPFLKRQADDIARLRRDEALALPDFDYAAIPGLSAELRIKLARTRPATLAQASRIEGMTPAALTLLLLRARQTATAAE